MEALPAKVAVAVAEAVVAQAELALPTEAAEPVAPTAAMVSTASRVEAEASP